MTGYNKILSSQFTMNAQTPQANTATLGLITRPIRKSSRNDRYIFACGDVIQSIS